MPDPRAPSQEDLLHPGTDLDPSLPAGTARIRVLGAQVELKLPVAECKIDAVNAVALGEAIAQVGRQAQGSHG